MNDYTQLDKDFIAACERAAELRPDLFEKLEFEYGQKFYVVARVSIVFSNGELFVSQDAIDRMAEAVGFQYQVKRMSNGTWGVQFWIEFDNWLWVMNGIHYATFNDKLSAAKAAWIEIVREIERGET